MDLLVNVGFLAFVFGTFYLLILRPQTQRQKQLDDLRENLKAGDAVVICGGIHGTVVKVEEHTVMVKIAENAKIKVSKAAVDERATPEEA